MKKGILIKCVLILITGGLVSSAFYSCGSAQKLGSDKEGNWELMILDAQSDTTNGYNLAAADIDGDGKQEIIMGGIGALSWYRPGTFEKDPISKGNFSVGLWLEDIDGDGELEIIGKTCSQVDKTPRMQIWKNTRKPALDVSFKHTLIERDKLTMTMEIMAADVDNDGKADVVSGTHWYKNPEWKRYSIPGIYQVIKNYDIDKDGENEIIAGEYDPFWTYMKRCRLMAYKKANPQGTTWYRYLIDGRFEHHNGAKIFEIEPGRTGILSKGWQDKKYIHLWEIVKN